MAKASRYPHGHQSRKVIISAWSRFWIFKTAGKWKELHNELCCFYKLQSWDFHSAILLCTPKLLSISIIEDCEGVSTVLSALLSRFQILPRCAYYDNACIFEKFVLIRVPWLNDLTRIACDRFHYRGPLCNSINELPPYPSADRHNTSNLQALNRLCVISKQLSRHSNPEILIHFLLARATFMNVRSLYRQRFKTVDTEDVELTLFASEILPCTCIRCSNSQ